MDPIHIWLYCGSVITRRRRIGTRGIMDKKVIEQFSKVVERLGVIAEQLDKHAKDHQFNKIQASVDKLSAKVESALKEKVY
jgi:predicted glycoside hydrolase/deacetylase ChbG (UPF0249 family)